MAKQAAPKPWKRERPGRYRSADGRFAIDQAGPGRWFLIDEAELDELGQPRTFGPLSTLDDAERQAEEVRSAPPEKSPLAARLADAAAKPKPARERRQAVDAKPSAAATSAPEKPALVAVPTWIDDLQPAEASRARRLIAALEKLNVDDAERIVRRDLQTAEPAIAELLLHRFIRAKVAEPWQSSAGVARLERSHPELGAALTAARDAGLDAEDLEALGRAIATVAADQAIAAVAGFERDPKADPRLPGWRLLERDRDRPEQRRLTG